MDVDGNGTLEGMGRKWEENEKGIVVVDLGGFE